MALITNDSAPDQRENFMIPSRCHIGSAASSGGTRIALAAVMMAVLAGCGSLKSKPTQSLFDEQFDDEARPWQEIAVQLPAVPATASLLPFDVSAAATQRFAVDEKSLTVGTDEVVRYTLVTLSSAGAKNVSYEGIRCATYERKIYALGREDGSWSRARRDQWEPIVNSAINRQQAALAQDYFCQGKGMAGNGNDMLRRLRSGQTLTKDLLR